MSQLSDKPPGHSGPNGRYNIASCGEEEMQILLIAGSGMGH